MPLACSLVPVFMAGSFAGSSVPLLLLDVLGVFVLGLSGALAAVRQRFDLFGALLLALA